MQGSSQPPGLSLGIQCGGDAQGVRIGLDHGMEQRIKGGDPLEVAGR